MESSFGWMLVIYRAHLFLSLGEASAVWPRVLFEVPLFKSKAAMTASDMSRYPVVLLRNWHAVEVVQ